MGENWVERAAGRTVIKKHLLVVSNCSQWLGDVDNQGLPVVSQKVILLQLWRHHCVSDREPRSPLSSWPSALWILSSINCVPSLPALMSGCRCLVFCDKNDVYWIWIFCLRVGCWSGLSGLPGLACTCSAYFLPRLISLLTCGSVAGIGIALARELSINPHNPTFSPVSRPDSTPRVALGITYNIP